MLRVLVLLVALVGAQGRVGRVFYSLEDAEHHFQQFIVTFGKQYASEKERNTRLDIFKENLKKINEQNSVGQAVFGINEFTDLTMEEFKQRYTGRLTSSDPLDDCKIADITVQTRDPAPDSLDWRDKGKVTNVKYQGKCGSCWAFGVTGTLESQYAIKHNKLVEFSEQQLIDCDDRDSGCGGGLQNVAFSWLMENGGLETEKDYPYAAKNGDCNFNKSQAVVQVTSCTKYTNVDEDHLKQLLAEVGPLSISVDATSLVGYTSGIFECSIKEDLNHAVLLVGYGKEGDTPYWLVKNSWGTKWGEEGYVRLAMYKNSCMMLDDVESAEVA